MAFGEGVRSMETGIEGRVAIVTGALGGIGRAICRKLGSLGAKVVVSDVSLPDTAQALSQEVKALGGDAMLCPADVSVAEEVQRLVDEVLGAYNRIDILVNNAGIVRDTLLLRMSDADWDQVLAVNLRGAFLCTRAVLRSMVRRRWGRIINMASVVGLVGNAGQANYAASKAGLIGLTKATAREVASRGITVNALAPGFIDTPMTQRLPDSLKGELLKQIPLGRFGLPEDVAAAVAFLASDEAAYITGQVLNIDGGMVMV